MKESILIVPEEFLLLMKEKQDKIISLLERSIIASHQKYLPRDRQWRSLRERPPGFGKCENLVCYRTVK